MQIGTGIVDIACKEHCASFASQWSGGLQGSNLALAFRGDTIKICSLVFVGSLIIPLSKSLIKNHLPHKSEYIP